MEYLTLEGGTYMLSQTSVANYQPTPHRILEKEGFSYIAVEA